MVHISDEQTSFEFWFVSLIAVLATGNTVISIVNDDNSTKANVINTGLTKIGIIDGVFQIASQEQLDAVVAHDYVTGAIVDSNTSLMHLINDKLAARSGAILPLLTASHHDNLFMRTVTGKTVSTDTTAAGGNASLMTMEIED